MAIVYEGPEFRHLVSFIAVAEECSFSGAAKRIRVAQTSLSAQIKLIEEGMGATLFVRGQNGTSLTVSGRQFLVFARLMLQMREHSVRATTSDKSGTAWPLRFGYRNLSQLITGYKLRQKTKGEGVGYAYVPYSSLESVIEQSKEGYYLALRQTQGTIRTETPDWQPWLVFFLRSMQQQMKRLAKKVEREKIVLSVMPELSMQIIEHAREHGRVTIGEMVTLTKTSRNTLKEHFKHLQEKGHIVLHGKGRGAWYALS